MPTTPNSFNKEERVAFEDILEGFNDALVMSRNVSVYKTDSQLMERANNVIWRPQPYIADSISGPPGTDISALYPDNTQLSVPATLGFTQTVPWTMNAYELRDALQEGRLGDAAKQKLASDINVQLMNVATAQGTLVVPITGAAGDFDDVALCDALMNETGVMSNDRFLALSSRDYNGLAGNLAVATRTFGNAKSDKAYERAYVGMVAGFDTYKLDYANRIQAAAGGGAITIDTTAAQASYVPLSVTTTVVGQVNHDNRTQTVTLSSNVGVADGDCFTIAGVNAVHHITKQDTGQLKTFRIIDVLAANQVVISPPIISAGGGTDPEVQYQNCVVTPNAAAAIVWLNANATHINPFWHKDALEILPGRYSLPENSGASVLRGTTDQGIELVWQKWYDIDTLTCKYRLDCLFGVVNKQPEMSGILLFNQ